MAHEAGECYIDWLRSCNMHRPSVRDWRVATALYIQDLGETCSEGRRLR